MVAWSVKFRRQLKHRLTIALLRDKWPHVCVCAFVWAPLNPVKPFFMLTMCVARKKRAYVEPLHTESAGEKKHILKRRPSPSQPLTTLGRCLKSSLMTGDMSGNASVWLPQQPTSPRNKKRRSLGITRSVLLYNAIRTTGEWPSCDFAIAGGDTQRP